MFHAATLHPDAAACAAAESLWDRLEKEGIPLGFDRSLLLPHVTLAVLQAATPGNDAVALEALQEWCRRFSSHLRGIPISFGSVGFFPPPSDSSKNGYTLFLGVPSGGPLYDVFQAFQEGLPDSCTLADSIYTPARWMPHLSLAIGLSEADLMRAIQVVKEAFQPFSGFAEDLELYEYFPVRRVLRIGLGACDCGRNPGTCRSCEQVRWQDH